MLELLLLQHQLKPCHLVDQRFYPSTQSPKFWELGLKTALKKLNVTLFEDCQFTEKIIKISFPPCQGLQNDYLYKFEVFSNPHVIPLLSRQGEEWIWANERIRVSEIILLNKLKLLTTNNLNLLTTVKKDFLASGERKLFAGILNGNYAVSHLETAPFSSF